MQWKYSLHALAVRDPAHGESFIQTAALTTDHDARKDLDSFLVPFYDARVYTHAVANRKRRDVAFLLLFLNNINDLVHKSPQARAAAGAHFPSKRALLQPEIALHSSRSTRPRPHRKSVKTC
jgi:hypothetical protein